MPKGSGRSGPSDETLLNLAKQLRTPNTVQSLRKLTQLDDSTLSRWLEKYLHSITVKDHRYFVLRGYEEGTVANSVSVPKVVVPKPVPKADGPSINDPSKEATLKPPEVDKWLNLYLKLGWELYKETKDSYILHPGQATAEPEQDVLSSDFRIYRDLSLDCARKMQDNDCSSYFRGICRNCHQQKNEAPMLQEFCPNCSKDGSFELAKRTITDNTGIAPPQNFVLQYLSYGYMKEMFLLVEKELRELKQKGDLSGVFRLNAAFIGKYQKLSTDLDRCGVYALSIESDLRHAFPKIIMLHQDEAIKAIELTFDCSRWHQGRAKGNEIAPILSSLYKNSLEKFEKIAIPIINQAMQQNLMYRVHASVSEEKMS